MGSTLETVIGEESLSAVVCITVVGISIFNGEELDSFLVLGSTFDIVTGIEVLMVKILQFQFLFVC